MRAIKGYLDEWRVQEYLLITFFISWLSWGILILLTAINAIKFASVPGAILFGIGGFGPTIAGIMCIEGKLTWQKFKEFIFKRQKRTWWFTLVYAVLLCLVIGLSSREINPATPWYVLPLAFVFCTLFGGGNEELGWRGTLQPVLGRIMDKKIKNKVLSFIVTTLCIGAIWALWHLPLWFVAGSGQQAINYGLFVIATLCEAFFLAAIYYRTHSVYDCMLFHGLSNVLMSFFVIKINWMLVVGFVVLLGLAICSVAKTRKTTTKVMKE